jgi:hypothetical protein
MAPSVGSELLFVEIAPDPKAWPLAGFHAARQLLPHERPSLRPKALAELAAVGWRLDEYAKGKEKRATQGIRP